jgi:hypothetical protein
MSRDFSGGRYRFNGDDSARLITPDVRPRRSLSRPDYALRAVFTSTGSFEMQRSLATSMLRLTIVSALLLSPVCAGTSAAQKKAGRRGRTTQAKQQPARPQKSEAELRLEKEIVLLSGLSADDKAAVRAVVEELDRAVRLYRVKGFDKYLTYTYSPRRDRMQALVTKAEKALPDGTLLKQLMTATWLAVLDAHKVERYYLENGGFGTISDDELLEIAHRYGLDNQPASVLGPQVLAKAAELLGLAADLSGRAGITSPATP